jgi:hypothetical protein
VIGELHAAVPAQDEHAFGQVVDDEPEALLAAGQVVEAAVDRALQHGVLGVGGELVGEDGGADARDQDAADAVARGGAVDQLVDADAKGGQRRSVAEQRARRQLLARRRGVDAVGTEGGHSDEGQAEDPEQVAEGSGVERPLALVEAVDVVADGERHGAEGGDLEGAVSAVEDGDEGHRHDGDVADRVGDQQRPIEAGHHVVLDHMGEGHLPEHEGERRGDHQRLGEAVQPPDAGPEVGVEAQGQEAGEHERQRGEEADVGQRSQGRHPVVDELVPRPDDLAGQPGQAGERQEEPAAPAGVTAPGRRRSGARRDHALGDVGDGRGRVALAADEHRPHGEGGDGDGEDSGGPVVGAPAVGCPDGPHGAGDHRQGRVSHQLLPPRPQPSSPPYR